MTHPTRFTNGVTNVAEDHIAALYPALFPAKLIEYFNDFHTYVAGDWTSTETEGGAGDAAIALTDGQGGLLLVTCDDADNDAVFLQKKGEGFKFVAGKKTWFEARFKTSDATQSDIVFGLGITDTTPLDSTDGVYFIKADGAATVDLLVEKNNTATTTSAVATLANDTFVKLGFFYDGGSYVYYYVDGVLAGKSVTTNICDDEELTISFGIQNGEAVAKTLTVDYIWAAQER